MKPYFEREILNNSIGLDLTAEVVAETDVTRIDKAPDAEVSDWKESGPSGS